MCLDPRPDRPYRLTRPSRALASRRPTRATTPPTPDAGLRGPALWALEHLAGDDDLVARGWVVLSREA